MTIFDMEQPENCHGCKYKVWLNKDGKCDRCGCEILPNTLCIECNDYLARSVFAEEIKQEIYKTIDEYDSVYYTSALHKALDIIDKHLKGEQE